MYKRQVNPRVSRSSALASKATGYPIAKVATKIALGYTLDEITNDVTGETCACFEPALDYVVVKYPKWPFDKFVYADKSLGTQMMATGEVMAIGNNFEHAMMKAVSSTELGLDTMTLPDFEKLTTEEVIEHLHVQDSERAFCVYEALKRGVAHDVIYDITKIDWWFLDKLQHLADIEMGLKTGELTTEKYLNAKRFGFLDKTIKRLAGVDTLPEAPKAAFKMVDTCAAEFAAKTPYFYSTYDEDNEAKQFIAERSDPNKKKVLVFGSGPIRIGQGIEFDYCSVHAVWTLKQHGCEAILVNNNPETVSTDFDTGDRLYFDPLNPESVDNIIATEKPDACVVQFGGQTAIKLAKHMDEIGLPILGTPADAIDEAEDRERFDELLVHFEHLLQIGRRSIFHVIARASGAGHGELRCQSGGNIMGGNFIPMVGDGKQANCCRAPWLWARNGLSRSAHVSESRRTSVHHDTARGYRDHGLKSEHPFARANRIRTKRHSNPLSTWSKYHPIVCSEADAVCSPCVRLNTRSMHTPLVWTSLCMTSDAAWDTKAYFGSGRAPACDPMSNSPPARECGCRKLLFCPGTAQKTEASRALDFRFRLRFSSRNRHRAKRRKLPAYITPLRAALACLVLPKIGASE